MFGSNLKWIEKQPYNFPYLACDEIKLFFGKLKKKKNCRKQSLDIYIYIYILKVSIYDVCSWW